MIRPGRLALWTFLAATLCACTFTRDKKADEHLALQEHQEHQAAVHETETVQTGSETITTTIEEYEAEEPPQVPAGPQAAAAQEGSQHPDGRPAPVRPLLVKRTVTVDQRSPVIATKAREVLETGAEDVGLDMTRHTEDDAKTSPALAGYLWMVLAAAVVAGAAWAAWKFSLPGKILAWLK